MFRKSLLLAFSTLLFVTPLASAQDMGSCKVAQGLRTERRGEGHSLTYGSRDIPVQLDCQDMQFMANFVETFHDKDLVVAQGDVVFQSGGTRISADRMEFNLKTKTGTFYNASGTSSMAGRPEKIAGMEAPDAYFWGDEIHKLGPKKYRLVRGNFTTCVQPTPRWDIGSGSITINMDDYALLTNSIFRVKGVPVMYLPVFYYPIQEDDRATGFLIPTYGASTYRGQTISNAFFWAIGRSHDATLFHDWFSKTGQGVGGEYRYVLSPGSQGHSTVHFINERATTAVLADGTERERGGTRSYTVRGNMIHRLPLNLRARTNVDYASSITTEQRYQQDLYRATQRTRRIGGNVSGNWGSYIFSATADRNDVFYNEEDYQTTGGLPRVLVSRSERPIGGIPMYWGVSGEYVTLVRRATESEVTTSDQGLTRLDLHPVLRIPFTRWSFLTANSMVGWRGTYWTERLENAVQVPDPIGRQYFELQSRITGPVFNRIFNTPGQGYAEKFKHVIEPSFTVRRVTAIDTHDQIVKLEGTDFERGNQTQYIYGLSNRLYAKKDVAREIVSATISQTYYTDATSALYDRGYQSGFDASQRPSHFSPIALQVRTAPTTALQAEFRTEWNSRAHAFLTMAAAGTFNHGSWLSTSAGWSQRSFIRDATLNKPERADHYLNASVNLRRASNRLGGQYSFNYDLLRDNFLQQRYVAYYNAQCCGIGVEYQTFNYQGAAFNVGIPQDRRFNLSFTLAGIGTFSNLFGAFGGQDR
jgi:LPS-assembly protein